MAKQGNNRIKVGDLDNFLPIMNVENNTIISVHADITVGFKIELPEVFSCNKHDYDTIHEAFVKALRVLPKYSIFHKQDWYIKDKYIPDINTEKELSFLERSFEKHFFEREFLNHHSYIYISKIDKKRANVPSLFNTLTRSKLVPQEALDKATVNLFFDTINQFEKILNDSGLLKLKRLTDDELVGRNGTSGVIPRYFSCDPSEDSPFTLEDIDFTDGLRIGDKRFTVFTLSDLDDMPLSVETEARYDKLSTDVTRFSIGYTSPLGLLLPANHVYNQYIMIDDHHKNLVDFEQRSRNLHSLSLYSRQNMINKEFNDLYLNEAISEQRQSVRMHCNVFAWTEESSEMEQLRSMVSSAIAQVNCRPRQNTLDIARLFWAGIPGNASDLPSEETFYTFAEQAVCFLTWETQYRSSLSPFGMKLTDRLFLKPIHVDLSDEPMKRGVVTNRNKFILGPSGSGKSFFTNHMVNQYYEQGTHIVIVDVGHSYKGLTDLIHNKTKGKDGMYFTFTEEKPIAFNPFQSEDGTYTVEKIQSIQALLLTLWKRSNEEFTRAEEVTIETSLRKYIEHIKHNKNVRPCFNTYYEYIQADFKAILDDSKVDKDLFDLQKFVYVLRPYYADGTYGYLLNSEEELNLLSNRFIIFELDNIKDHPILFPVVTLIIMETFIAKMRKLQGIRKMILIEEAWKAIAKEGMAEYIKYLFKTVRKYFGEAVVVTQEVDDIIGNTIVKDAIINNSDCKILLDQRKYMNRFSEIESLLGLTDKERQLIMSVNRDLKPTRKYKEVFISLGGSVSKVYATEVSLEEYGTYTTEQTEKFKIFQMANENGGNMELAIKNFADSMR